MVIRTRFFISTVFVLVAISCFRLPPALAQWTVVKSFGVQVRSVYFLDQQGSSTTGFAGLANSSIWRTVDNGVTWSPTSTPYTTAPMQITDFAFSDKLLGWCSVRSSFGDWGEIWRTIDGGVTWDSIYGGGAFSSIAYCVATGVLIAPCWSYGTDSSVVSKDSGFSWTNFAPPWLNGATFNGSDGVIGNISSSDPLYTTDGGLTWSAPFSLLFDTVEAWAPHGIAGTTAFVAAAEKTRQFFCSTDGGASWKNPYTFPFAPNSYLTGSIMGTLAGLFVQTEGMGFYFSSDTGKTWTSICGPNNTRDTRFYSIGNAIFAGDASGNIWYTPDAASIANPTLGFDRTSFSFFGVRCATYDSILHFTYGTGCRSATLTKVQILTGAPEFSIGALSLPRFFSGMDSIGILYSPSPALRDSGTIELEFVIGTSLVDTIIRLYGTGQSAASIGHNDSLVMSSTYACLTSDSSIVLQNLSCDTLTISSATLTDKSIFQLLPFKLPYKIAPLDSVAIPIAASSSHDGSFSAMLHLFLLGGGSVKIEDSIPITLNVLQGAEAQFGVLDLSMPYACHDIDTVFSITNTKCDSITMLKATLSDTSVFHLGSLALPILIKAAGKIDLPIHIVPGSKGIDTTLLQLQYVSGQSVVDTSITLITQVLYDLPLHVELADSAFDLGSAGVPCAMASRWVTFRNVLCSNLTIERISWVGSNSQFWFDPISLPDTMASDTGVDSILVHFKPAAAIMQSNQLRVTLDLDGREMDTILTFSGTGISSYHDTLLTPVLQYDSIPECQSSERDGELVNLSCDSAIVISATILGNLGYTIISPLFPMTLHPGDTLRVRFGLQPKQVGAATDSAIITLHNPLNDSDYTHTIVLAGYIIPSIHALSLNNSTFSLPSLSPCSVADSFITVTNRGTCDDVVINDTSFTGYSGIVFDPPLSLPIVIHPDSSIHIDFRIVPNGDVAENTQLSLRGQNIDTSINFAYASLPGGVQSLAMSVPDSVFYTRPCVPVSRTFWIANTGCDSVAIDTLSLNELAGASEFTLQNAPGLPAKIAAGDTVQFIVQFDPNGNGNGLATLDIKSKGANFSRFIGLSGGTIGTVPTARIALQSSDGSLQSSGMAKDLASVVAVLLDDIGDSSQLSTVMITLHANWNLLTPLKFSPAAGWSVVNTNTLPDGDFQIRIHHDAAGAVRAGTALVTASFYITTSDSVSCDIAMSNLRFNDSSTTYENCVLASLPMPIPVHFSEIDTCGTPELRSSMEDRLALHIISIIPNPASIMGGVAQMNVTFSLARAGDVRIVVRDLLGREYMNSTHSFAAGTHAAKVDVNNATEGIYFVQMEFEGQIEQAKAVIQNIGEQLSK